MVFQVSESKSKWTLKTIHGPCLIFWLNMSTNLHNRYPRRRLTYSKQAWSKTKHLLVIFNQEQSGSEFPPHGWCFNDFDTFWPSKIEGGRFHVITLLREQCPTEWMTLDRFRSSATANHWSSVNNFDMNCFFDSHCLKLFLLLMYLFILFYINYCFFSGKHLVIEQAQPLIHYELAMRPTQLFISSSEISQRFWTVQFNPSFFINIKTSTSTSFLFQGHHGSISGAGCQWCGLIKHGRVGVFRPCEPQSIWIFLIWYGL